MGFNLCTVQTKEILQQGYCHYSLSREMFSSGVLIKTLSWQFVLDHPTKPLFKKFLLLSKCGIGFFVLRSFLSGKLIISVIWLKKLKWNLRIFCFLMTILQMSACALRWVWVDVLCVNLLGWTGILWLRDLIYIKRTNKPAARFDRGYQPRNREKILWTILSRKIQVVILRIMKEEEREREGRNMHDWMFRWKQRMHKLFELLFCWDPIPIVIQQRFVWNEHLVYGLIDGLMDG